MFRLFRKIQKNTPAVLPNNDVMLVMEPYFSLIICHLTPEVSHNLLLTCHRAYMCYINRLLNAEFLFCQLNKMTPVQLERFQVIFNQRSILHARINSILSGEIDSDNPKLYVCAALLCESIMQVNEEKLRAAFYALDPDKISEQLHASILLLLPRLIKIRLMR